MKKALFVNALSRQSRSSLRIAIAIACGSLVLSACAKIDDSKTAAAPQGPADISGVWQISQPVTALKTVEGKLPPLLPEAQKIYDEHVAKRAAGDTTWDPAAKCKPLGEPRAFMEMGWPFQILQSEGRIDIAYQWNRLVHTIPIQKEHGVQQGPFYFGESIGRWEGDTLVVDIINVREESLLDDAGLPHTDDMHMIERIRTTDAGNKLEVKFHIDDPKTYSQPWDAVLTFDKKPDLQIQEDVCFERLKLNDYATLDNSVEK